MIKNIAIGCDHAGFPYKAEIIEYLKKQNYNVQDFGTHSEESVDYPDYVHPVANSISNKENEMGVLMCGSANGVAISANKHKIIRAAIAWNKELSILARQHNDANVICIPVRFISLNDALQIIDAFFSTNFEGGRHTKRVEKISEY